MINHKKGFTLIELLVVVAIVGFLSSVVLSSLQQARSKARDARRLVDIVQIKSALLSYSFDNKGIFYDPIAPSGWTCLGRGDVSCHGGFSRGSAAMDAALAPYMKFPIDPLGPGSASQLGGSYMYNPKYNATKIPALHWGMETCEVTSKTCLGGQVDIWTGYSTVQNTCNVHCFLPIN